MFKPKAIELDGTSKNDIVIALMGPTGAGKSTFINTAINEDSEQVGHTLRSCTAEIRAVRIAHPITGSPVVFIDTPGFDDTYKPDTEILKTIARWLEKTYKNNIKLAGIIYLHRITDNRMAGTPFRNLRMFANLCGDEAIRNVVLATTMWELAHEDIGSARECELRETYWRPMLNSGSATARFTNTFDSAWDIVDGLLEKRPADSLLLQEELVDLGRRLSETQAGMELFSVLQELLATQKDTIRKLQREAELQRNPALVQELNNQWAKLESDLRKTFDQIEEIKVPFGRRVRLLFTFRRSRAHALEVLNVV